MDFLYHAVMEHLFELIKTLTENLPFNWLASGSVTSIAIIFQSVSPAKYKIIQKWNLI